MKAEPAKKMAPSYDFKALMGKIVDAWSTEKPENAAPYYAKDAGLVFYDIAPFKYTGWTEYATGSVQMFSNYSSLSLKLNDDAQAHQHGNLAWGTATFHADATKTDGTKEAFDCRWSVVWEKRGSDWLVVHEHTSTPLPMPETKQ